MNTTPVYIAGIGIISSLGSGLSATEQALRDNRVGIAPLHLFPLRQKDPLVVGEVPDVPPSSTLPRTHQLAERAAAQAMKGQKSPPDAVIVGTTTGGILTTEQLLREKQENKRLYRYHGLTTVADRIAEKYHSRGPILTVSTACSSGAVAITLAMAMLRSGRAVRVLVGGADSLCRLTYFGFHSLQLVDRSGCKPMDKNRQGMAVAEGAAFLVLTTQRPDTPLAQVAGAGLSCDAYHPAAPHPEGEGAVRAIQSALADAGLQPADVDYISLHGTGTRENDLAESRAIHTLFSPPPPLSSIKGATGHSLAAAGAIEAAVAALLVSRDFIPANTGCREPDPALKLQPLDHPFQRRTATVLSNSFGFGGNNGCLVITKPQPLVKRKITPKKNRSWLGIYGRACWTGSGDWSATMARIFAGGTVSGMTSPELIVKALSPAMIRRLKRLPRMALSLAQAAREDSGLVNTPSSVFMGTGWGALSETWDFLTRLDMSDEQFPSPTDFVGSVHNAPAGQVAILLGATGANITTSGGDTSFEQALLAADFLLSDSKQSALILGVDEGHDRLSPLLDSSIAPDTVLADGGGAFVVRRTTKGAKYRVQTPFYSGSTSDNVIEALAAWCGGTEGVANSDLILLGLPAAERAEGEVQLQEFIARTACTAPILPYRPLLGEFASSSAVAAVIATGFLERGRIPGVFFKTQDMPLAHGSILVLGLGRQVTAMEFSCS